MLVCLPGGSSGSRDARYRPGTRHESIAHLLKLENEVQIQPPRPLKILPRVLGVEPILIIGLRPHLVQCLCLLATSAVWYLVFLSNRTRKKEFDVKENWDRWDQAVVRKDWTGLWRLCGGAYYWKGS